RNSTTSTSTCHPMILMSLGVLPRRQVHEPARDFDTAPGGGFLDGVGGRHQRQPQSSPLRLSPGRSGPRREESGSPGSPPKPAPEPPHFPHRAPRTSAQSPTRPLRAFDRITAVELD